MKHRIALFLLVLWGVGALAFEGWLVWRALASIKESIVFQPYPQPYRATVVGFDRHVGVKSSTYAPIVEVVSTNEKSFRFKSSRSSSFNFLSVGDSVEVIYGTGANILGMRVETYEINDAFHLWIKDVIVALIIPSAGAFVFLWEPYRKTRGPLIVSPIRRLRRIKE